jgi:hypothetical protein
VENLQCSALHFFVNDSYTGTLDSGEQFDSSRERGEPLCFILGMPGLIPGFVDAVEGLAAGEKRRTRIEATQAYGMPRDDMVISVPRANAPEGLHPGMQLELTNGMPVRGVKSLCIDVLSINIHGGSSDDIMINITIIILSLSHILTELSSCLAAWHLALRICDTMFANQLALPPPICSAWWFQSLLKRL